MAIDPAKLAGTERARNLLAQSAKSVADMLIVFESMADRISRDEMTKAELASVLKAHAEARTQLIKVVVQHENDVLVEQKLVAHAPLNFDELRRDIGRKLDRLRYGGDAKGVSGVSDE